MKSSFRGGSDASEPGISRFRACAPSAAHPGMTRKALFPVDDPALVAIELHAAERAALVEVADGIGPKIGLLGHRVLAKILSAAGRAIAAVVGAMIVPPRALVLCGADDNPII